ncbi:hypothetical protein BT69DRAFT_1350120 [Atractiella rhizophila]|nr:hypothetical protein BT69DRAFT_1350120 [Atractiella rhizophila]
MATSELAPVDLSHVSDAEREEKSNWLLRHIVQSLPGRMTFASLETLKASTSILCLSPWGDANPLLLPCIRFRDVVIHTVIAATGGTAVFAAPAVSHAVTEVVSLAGGSILVEIGVNVAANVAAKATTDAANELLGDLVYKKGYDVYRDRRIKILTTTDVKTMTVTLKYKHMLSDAYLGYFKGSDKVHKSTDLWGSENTWTTGSWSSLTNPVKEYLSVSKGWFCPYLYASSRRPVIPRKLSPDIIFSHGPFLEGDYALASRLLAESIIAIQLTKPATPSPASPVPATQQDTPSPSSLSSLNPMNAVSSLTKRLSSEELIPVEEPPPRRLIVFILGLKPHRAGLWTSSSRPGESILQYQLLNGCPTLCIPALKGSPLQAWDTMTLREIQKIPLPSEEKEGGKKKYQGLITVLWEFLNLCIDWERVELPKRETVDAADETVKAKVEEDAVITAGGEKELAVKSALELIVESAIRTRDSKIVQKEVDLDRAGIVIMRLP